MKPNDPKSKIAPPLDAVEDGSGVSQQAGDEIPQEEDQSRDELLARLSQLEEIVSSSFAQIQKEFEQKFAFDDFKEEQISRLHAELQSYRNDLIGQIKAPLLQGLIRLHDDLGKTVHSIEHRPPEEQTPERFFGAFAGFVDDIELLLGQHGVEPFESPEETFDPRRQTALRTEPTTDPDQVGLLAQRLRPGFEQSQKVLQKERVAVYKAAPELTADSESPEIDETPRKEVLK